MPEAARKTDEANHVPANGWSVHIINEGSPNVNINGLPAARVGDKLEDHFLGILVHFPGSRVPVVKTGSSTVFINGKAAARKDDEVDCSSKILEGSPNVNIGG